MASKLRLFTSISIFLTIAVIAAYAAQKSGLPELDGNSSDGLQIECRPEKSQVTVGEPINIWCTITNTTDRVKPVGWNPRGAMYFSLVEAGRGAWEAGLRPDAVPFLERSVTIKSADPGKPFYALYVPAHRSIQMLMTRRSDRPMKFKGTLVYDPVAIRGEWTGSTDIGPAWKDELVSSNDFEFEVLAPPKKK